MHELSVRIQRFEAGFLSESDRIALFQTLLDSERIFDMPAYYALEVMRLLRAGQLIMPLWFFGV